MAAELPAGWPAFGGLAPDAEPAAVKMPEPGHLRWTVDPRTRAFGNGRRLTEVARVSDAEASGLDRPGNVRQMAHAYAKDSPWNADGSLALLVAIGRQPQRAVLLDGRTFAFRKEVPGARFGGRWSMMDPSR